MAEKKVDLPLVIAPLPVQIDFAAETAKDAIKSLVAPYHGLIVTDDNVKDMEGARKELTSYRTRIEKFRRETKREAMKPIDNFDHQIFEIMQLITEEEDALKEQLQKYDDARIADCRNKAEAELNKIAVKYGIREEYLPELVLPRQILNKGSWTSRGVMTGAALNLLDTVAKEVLGKQQQDDERTRIADMNRQSVGILCSNYSEKYSLSTPVTPDDLPPGFVENVTPQDLEAKVVALVKERAEVELKVRQEAEAAAKAQMEAEAAAKAAEETAEKSEYEKTLAEKAAKEAAMAEAELMESMGVVPSQTVIITIKNVPSAVVAKLQAGKKLLGCEYTLEVI